MTLAILLISATGYLSYPESFIHRVFYTGKIKT